MDGDIVTLLRLWFTDLFGQPFAVERFCYIFWCIGSRYRLTSEQMYFFWCNWGEVPKFNALLMEKSKNSFELILIDVSPTL